MRNPKLHQPKGYDVAGISVAEMMCLETAGAGGALVPVYFFREPREDGGADADKADEREESGLQERGRIVCARCKHEVSSPACIAPVAPHPARRVVSNPAGVLFEIITVTDAWGLLSVGAASTEFSWFEDTRWTVVCCGGCGAHLGWHFASLHDATDPPFFGLIVGAVVEEQGL